MKNDSERNNDGVTETRQPGRHVSSLGRLGFVIVAIFACTASDCSFGGGDDDDAVAANPPAAPSPPQSPPPSAPVETCWEEGIDIDPVVGCHRVSFDVKAGDPEIYEAVLTYPDYFEFNGFDLVGPPGTPVGTVSLDLTFDGSAERSLTFTSLDHRTAYADVFAASRFNPTFSPVIEHMRGNEFRLRLPFGGDANVDTLTVPFATRVTLRVREELMTAGVSVSASFTVSAELTSVDPDTDGPDDGQNAAPTVTPVTADVAIVD